MSNSFDIEALDIDGNQSNNHLFIAQVVGIHISDEVIVDGRFEVNVPGSVSRFGYFDYSTVYNLYEMMRPIHGE